MHPRKQTRRTFREILQKSADHDAASLMERARRANALAKSLNGRARARAYRVKHRALVAIIAHFPEQVRIIDDQRAVGFVVVSLPEARFGLHGPADQIVDQILDIREKKCAA